MRQSIKDQIFKTKKQGSLISISINGYSYSEEDDLSPDEVSEICDAIVKNVPDVQIISLVDNDLNDECCEIISQKLRQLKKLKILDMQGNRFGEKGLISLFILQFHIKKSNKIFHVRPRSRKLGGDVLRYYKIEEKARLIFDSNQSDRDQTDFN